METDANNQTPATLTAEEKRQRRMAKILANAGNRMDRILSVGGEKRLAPAMEGGEGFQAESPILSTLTAAPVSATAPSTSSEDSLEREVPGSPQLEFESVEKIPVNKARGSSISTMLSNRRFDIALTIGIILASVSSYFGPFNVILPLVLAFMSLEYFVHKQSPPSPNLPMEMTQILATLGMQQQKIGNYMYLFNAGLDFMADTGTFTFAFIATKFVLQFVSVA